MGRDPPTGNLVTFRGVFRIKDRQEIGTFKYFGPQHGHSVLVEKQIYRSYFDQARDSRQAACTCHAVTKMVVIVRNIL
jgi:hypothetical protein